LGILTRVPHREQNAEFGADSNPHWGHLIEIKVKQPRS
jgi:hypothetical protein